ncbi:T9SS type A sorting domain-containing protein [candidate division KSB1 bacterium]
MKKRIITILLFALIFGSSLYSYSTTYYVNGLIGDDLNDGLSAIPSTVNHGPKETISAALSLVQPFDTVIIAAGIYREAITIDSVMVMMGAGAGSDTLTNTIIKSPLPNSGVGISLNTTGLDSINRMIIKDLRVDGYQNGIMFASYTTYENVAAVYNAAYGFYLPSGQALDVKQISCQASYNTQGGIFIGHTADVDGWLIDSCRLEENIYSGLYIFCNNPSTANVKNFIFRNSILRKNFQKGMYIEKLQDALFENLIIDSCGYNPSYNYNAGIDINLKYNNYSNIEIRYCDITNCGLGGSSSFGCGLIVKGRDDGATYGANPATLDNVLITNVDVSGSLNGIIIGEPNASNATPTDVSIQISDLSGVVSKSLVNNIKSDVKAHNNWWGAYAQPDTSVFSLNDTGDVKAYTFLEHGMDFSSPGFGPAASLTFDPQFPTLENAISVLPFQWFFLKVPTFNYQGLTVVNNIAVLEFCNNVVIEDLLLDSTTSVSVSQDTGFAISSSITSKNWSYMEVFGEGIELYPNATISEAPRNVINGTIFTERMLTFPGSTEDFGGLGIEITNSVSGVPPGSVVVKRHTDFIWPGNYTKIPREFEVLSQNNQGLDATLKYIYDDSEVDSIASESKLALFRSMNNGNTWILEGGFLDTANNSITVTGLDSISGIWAAFDSTGYSLISEWNWENNIQLFPNPSPDGFFTLIADGPYFIRIYDPAGRVILMEDMKYNGKIIKKIDLPEVSKGMYFLEVISLKGQKVVKKVILN